MKTFATLTLALSAAGLMVFAPTAGAQGAQGVSMVPQVTDMTPRPGDTMTSVPVVQSNGVRYLNGGASIEEVAYLKTQSRDYPLQFTFSGRGGEYGVADSLTLRSSSGDVLTVADAGPLLMMQVPPGRYTVEAHFGNGVERRTVNVGQGVSKVNWNTPKVSN